MKLNAAKYLLYDETTKKYITEIDENSAIYSKSINKAKRFSPIGAWYWNGYYSLFKGIVFEKIKENK